MTLEQVTDRAHRSPIIDELGRLRERVRQQAAELRRLRYRLAELEAQIHQHQGS